mmetsp:Transcript_424/g.800  ORF Transcript_424/g.800 Transcript_424/m.800 type:complete len:518 (+) Transcript_424:47-1600(+)
MPSDTFYAVRGGPRPGIYSTWDEASKHTQGQSGALCKKFKDRDSAAAFLGVKPASPTKGQAGVPCTNPVPCTKPEGRPTAEAFAGVKFENPLQSLATPCRTYLEVPFAQKDEAKRLGAKWDPQCKKWFAPSEHALPALSKWLRQSTGLRRSASEPVFSRATPNGADDGEIVRPPQVHRRMTSALSSQWNIVAEPEGTELAVFTDGACRGNRNVRLNNCPAGWGAVVIQCSGRESCHVNGAGQVVAELYGPVILDANSPFFLGAEVQSNNTGELSGVCEALLWLRDQELSQRPAVLYYDSKYAGKVAQKDYRAHKNQQLAASATSLVEEVRARRTLRLEHVKGHSNHAWNDHADRLANRGASGDQCFVGRFHPCCTAGVPDNVVNPLPPSAVASTSEQPCMGSVRHNSDVPRNGAAPESGQPGMSSTRHNSDVLRSVAPVESEQPSPSGAGDNSHVTLPLLLKPDVTRAGPNTRQASSGIESATSAKPENSRMVVQGARLASESMPERPFKRLRQVQS